MALANQPLPEPGDEPAPLELSETHVLRAREAMVQRLCDIVAWPESRIHPQERHLAADVLVGLLRTCSTELRQRCAHGLVRVNEAPKALLRYLARDEIGVAQQLLIDGVGFDDSDLIATIRAGLTWHWMAIAKRRNLREAVTDALMQTGDASVIDAALRNNTAHFSTQGIDLAVSASRQHPHLATALVARLEIKPAQALTLFWWCGFEARTHILRRFAVDRQVLIQELGDVFKLAAQEGWADAETRKTLQVVERRQRNRAAATQSPYGSLEGLLTAAAESGLDPERLRELAHLAGIKPTTAAQIVRDPGGEALGVLCKSVGLKRPMLLALWRALRRPMGDAESTDNPLGRALYSFDTLATAKAQTVLRYWNWSFTADSAGIEQLSAESEAVDLSVARRNAALLFTRNS